ncbi:serine/threonine-protein kinase [Parahaliea aestuarii]|uniref:Protein kinase n=1 Tax=Parahaliea aestuarii TaxID=1852021 RepID=A0A5C9A3Q8_9GAMM|nr:serine/threonine-protein kinase [Parahaliea aestuarii]TXS94624.1 protein kinase [Parahaliea aestuarii]
MAKFEIPGYEIYEQLGRGGMASVYRALHINLDREVAIKVIDTDKIADESFSERFVREARISARLSHPHILQIYDVNVYGSLNYISMELLHGGDLEDIIRGAMNQRTIYQVMAQMTAALDYAAAKGYVHRDIKPSNIMRRGSDDFVLADFGIAKAADSSTQMTQAGLLVGTPSYMSPEQAEGVALDGRSDLYSLAVVAYEMLTKTVPYEADSAVSTAVKHLTEKIPRLPKHLAAYQPFLDKGMAKKADDRFQSGYELYEAFCAVRNQFSDDDVLTQPRSDSPQRKTPAMGTRLDGDQDSDRTVVWSDTGSPIGSRVSGGYQITSSHADGMISGIRNERRTGSSRRRSGAGKWALAAIVLTLAAGGAGGYLYLQQQNPVPAEDLSVQNGELQALLGEANTALAANDLERARELLDEANALAPGKAAVAQLERNWLDAREALQQRGAEEVQRVTAQNIEVLLKDGRALADSGDPASAGDKFQTALRLDPESADARSGLEEAVESLGARADDAIAEGDFTRAESELNAALALAPQQETLKQRLAELPALAEARGQQQLVSEGQALLKQNDFAAAAKAFAAAEPNTPGVPEGLAASAAGLVAAAQRDVAKHKYASAREQLAVVQQWAPDHPEASALMADIPALEKAWQQEQAAIAARKAAASRRASEALQAVSSGDLDAARQGYDALMAEFPEMAVTRDVRQRLLDAYTEAVREEMEVKSWDTALSLIADGQVVAPEQAVWKELQEEVEYQSANDRRRLGAY